MRMRIQKLASRVARRFFQRRALRITQMKALLSKGQNFGVLSAYTTTSKSENKRRHSRLIRALQQMGYTRWEPLKGTWEGVSEKSILVPNIHPQDLFRLGRKFDQDAVIYKSNKGVIGMYYLKGTPKAYVAVDPDKIDDRVVPDVDISADPDSELYSQARGIKFEFGFIWEEIPWDGRHPISVQEVLEEIA